MNRIYLAIVLLTLYGDILKRYVPAQLSLILLYGGATGILFWLIVSNRSIRPKFDKPNPVTARIRNYAFIIVIIYAIQFAIIPFIVDSRDISLRSAIIGLLYISIPLLYVVVIINYCPSFDLPRLSQIFLVLMVPVNIVGFIQYNFDSNFLVSTSYSETGGIVFRNTYAGHMLRLPSIFVSSDRYSGIGLIQFYFAFVILLMPGKKTFLTYVWVIFNLFCSLGALVISGARSRMLIIVIIGVGLAIISLRVFFSYRLFNWLNSLISDQRFVSCSFLVLGFGCLVGAVYLPSISTLQLDIELPSADFLIESIQRGDIQFRLSQVYEFSQLPIDVTILGKGIGYFGGKPIEYGISFILSENGVIGGLVILAALFGIIANLGFLAIRALLRLQYVRFVGFGLPAMAISMGLSLGLTAVLELSQGVLLLASIGAIMQYQDINFKAKQIIT